MTSHALWVAIAGALLVTSIAAVTDARTGRIPNWLTLPALLGASCTRGVLGGASALLDALLGAFVCGLAPFVVYRMSRGQAIGGGDVKLFAALGACLGPTLGLEVQFASYTALLLLAAVRLTWSGRLARLFANTFWLALNPLLPSARRRRLEPEMFTAMRMGPAVLLGTISAIVCERGWAP